MQRCWRAIALSTEPIIPAPEHGGNFPNFGHACCHMTIHLRVKPSQVLCPIGSAVEPTVHSIVPAFSGSVGGSMVTIHFDHTTQVRV